ncbi:protein trichome birefringence-like 8 [Impatiens glandulifera]|uniref:protein trichome birefringence-like 8 n=1 Tax=Impatiens glandulifera TaxID=253017 RepID=UPI001FB1784A|nr:protein trichome birefringence-like 8 [Impatiens glandulifera]
MDNNKFPPRQLPTFQIFTKKELKITFCFLFLILITLLIIPFSFQPTSLFFSLGFRFRFRRPPISDVNSLTKPVCDFSKGRWVWDETYPIQLYDEDCPFLDPGFRCRKNGRLDKGYRNWRWQPENCLLPRFNASDFLNRSRNGRIVFAGDSIGRNQWESFLCMLSQGVSNKSLIYEEHGKPISKHRGFLSFMFFEYNLTVQYYRLPFLVTIDRPPLGAPKIVKGTIRVDKLHWYFDRWAGADVLVFNGGHWWNSDKTTKMGLYFQEGESVNMKMDVMDAFSKSLKTWRSWVLANFNAKRDFVFFCSFAPVHYRNGTWNEGGNCDDNKEPETKQENIQLEPQSNNLVSQVLEGMNSAQLLNITYLSEIRKDGHPSKYREPGTPIDAPQDCSHWCLPGVPDTWNELLYAHLLAKNFRTMTTR